MSASDPSVTVAVAASPRAHTSTTPTHIRTNFAGRGASLVPLRSAEALACARLADGLRVAFSAGSKSTLTRFLDLEIRYLERFNATMYRLSAPPDRAVDYKRFVYANEGALDLFRKLEPYISGGRTNATREVQLMERASVADRDASKYGRRLGLSACATGQMHRG